MNISSSVRVSFSRLIDFIRNCVNSLGSAASAGSKYLDLKIVDPPRASIATISTEIPFFDASFGVDGRFSQVI